MSVRDILDRTDLASVLTELAGDPAVISRVPRWRCCAADHNDEHPSVTMFHDRKGVERWKCWSGDHAGTAVDAVIAARRVTTVEAIRQLEARAGLEPITRPVGTPPVAVRNEPQPLSTVARDYATECAGLLWTPAGAPALHWLHARGLSDQVLRLNMVGFDPGTRNLARPDGLRAGIPGVTIASFGADGTMTYIQHRRLNMQPRADGTAPNKYTNPTSAHGTLPTLSYPRPTPGLAGPVLITEGVTDGLLATAAGFRAVSLLSATSARTLRAAAVDELVAFAGAAGVVIAVDNDPAGRTAETNLRDHLQDRTTVKVLRLPDRQDLTDTFLTGQPHHQHAMASAR